MSNFGLSFFGTSNDNQNAKPQSNLSFENLNLSTDGSQNSNVFSSCMPTLNMVFGQNTVQPAKNQLVDSKLMFNFRQPKSNNLPAQPLSTPPAVPVPSKLELELDLDLEPEPEPEQKRPSESSELIDYISSYTKALNSSLSTVVINEEICTNPVVKRFSHSLLSSYYSHIYSSINTSTGVTLLTIDVAHSNQLSKQQLNISDYVTDLTVDPFDDNLILFSQLSKAAYILNRVNKQVITSYSHVLAYYPYYSYFYRKTYIFLLMVDEAISGVNILILDMKTRNLHRCPTPIFTFDFLDREVRKLINDETYSFSSVDVMRAYICPFGASTDICLDAPTSDNIHQSQAIQFEESVFYAGLEIMAKHNKTVLIHSIIGPILLEPLGPRIPSLSKIKASDSIKMISADNFSVDFYMVQSIQSLVIVDEDSVPIVGITPVAVCSSDDDVYSHFFLCICWGGKKMSTSLYELRGAETFLYECNNSIDISLQDAVFSYGNEATCIHHVTALRNGPFNTNGVGTKILLLGTKIVENTTHEFTQTILNVANASLEETSVIKQGDFPIILGYDPCHQFMLCASSTSKTVSIFYKISQPTINHDSILSKGLEFSLVNQSTSHLSTASHQLNTQWLSRLSTNKLFDDSLVYLKNTPVNQMDPNVLGAKLKSLNDVIIAVLSHSFPGEESPIGSLLKTTESLLRNIFNNNNLLLQLMKQIGENLVQLSCESVPNNNSCSASMTSNNNFMGSYCL